MRSAGSDPTNDLNPSVVALLLERGLDAGREFPKAITEQSAREADVIVTMGCGESCPVYPGKRYEDWEINDPAGQPTETARLIVNEIDRRVQVLMKELLPGSHL